MTDAQILDAILRREGGFVDHPADRGKATKYGITLATLSKWRRTTVTAEDVRQLSEDEARAIYRAWYLEPWSWVPDGKVRAQLVDWYVTSSPPSVIKGLQRAVGAAVDGVLGQETKRLTLGAISRGDLSAAILRERVEHYLSLALNEPRLQVLVRTGPPLQIVFLRGWLLRALEAAA